MAAKQVASQAEEIDPTKYYENRIKYVKEAKAAGKNLYPHKFHVSISVTHFLEKYNHLEKGVSLEEKVTVAGRVVTHRESGQKLFFLDIQGEGKKLQIFVQTDNLVKTEGLVASSKDIHRGDIIGVEGLPTRTKTGELSVKAITIKVLTPCLRALPNLHAQGLAQETRYRQRYLDLILTPGIREKFIIRAKMMSYLRQFLENQGFLEVETPMMNMIAGGAAARPFRTHHHDLKLDMSMRISPELFLKVLVVGGIERVFEIGRQFRNESIDLTHNPEFTSCEFYMAYADYEDLMVMTEVLVSGMVKAITGSYQLEYDDPRDKSENPKKVIVDFTPPFKRISMIRDLETELKAKYPQLKDVKFPTAAEYGTEETEAFFDKLCNGALTGNGVVAECEAPRTTSRLVDKLVGEFLECQAIERPVFIMDHPAVMSPLAKWHSDASKLGQCARFELFVCQKELCNAYTELNDPIEQRERFADQLKNKDKGDLEAQEIDESFCQALEYGLPPTGGWGMGLDRMAMFLTGSPNIKEVLFFPAMKPIGGVKEEKKTDATKPHEDTKH